MTRILAVLALISACICGPAVAPAHATQFLSSNRPIATLSPRITKMRRAGCDLLTTDPCPTGWTDEEIAQALSVYDAHVIYGGDFNVGNAAIFNRVKELNPRVNLTLMWPFFTRDCSNITTLTTKYGIAVNKRAAELVDFLRAQGPFHALINFIEIDGITEASAPVAQGGCGLAAVQSAFDDYRPLLDATGYSIPLIANGSKYPHDSPSCGYVASGMSIGPIFSNTIPDMTGRVQESWSRYFDPTKFKNLTGMLAESCAWATYDASVGNGYSIEYGKCDTPWWNERGLPATWACARLSFVLAMMQDRTAYIQSPADTDLNQITQAERLFRLDYYAVDVATNMPPAYVKITTARFDNFAQIRAARGFLRPASAPMHRSGNLIWRAYGCGYLIGNIGSVPLVFPPAGVSIPSTQHIVGRQDRANDDGSSWASYQIEPHDGLLLMKNTNPNCFAVDKIRSMHQGTWVRH